MEKKQILQQLPEVLLPWYREHRRELPWRADREPYHVWLSEIMLQQTRVEAVKGYYTRFLQELPTVADLAGCPDDRLHKLWEGLGYYSRVRNLKKAAMVIQERFGGRFPETYEEVLALPGIGAYTAGAVCSIAYDLPRAAVDGNVLRLVSRLTDDPAPIDLPQTKAAVKAALEEVYPAQAGDFTQALMELGATLCGPNRPPECESCPCRTFCQGYLHGTAGSLPVKSPKRGKRTEKKTVLILSCEGSYALCKRDSKGLLAGLWEFPNLPGILTVEEAVSALAGQGIGVKEILRQTDRKHIFTHIVWKMRGYYLEVREKSDRYTWFTAEQIRAEAALPTAFRQFWEEYDHV